MIIKKRNNLFRYEFAFYLLNTGYLYGFLDLATTYYIENKFNSVELNGLVGSFGWGFLVLYKLILGYFMFKLSVQYKSYLFVYIFMFLNLFVVYWNIYQILSTL